jgi:DNA invertase Pin-like site-specific DNA recombinase
MTAQFAACYLRRSQADDANPGAVSREAQEAAVRGLVARDGYTGQLREYVDWNRSADEAKEGKRTAFLAMLKAIERGQISVLYAASIDRLYRSMRTFVALQDAAKAHDVRIVTAREGVLGGDGSPMAQAFSEISAVFTSMELNTIKARNSAALAARRARGDRMGSPPYGQRIVRDATGQAVRPIQWEPDPERPLQVLLDAYATAGSVQGACKLLNAQHVPTPQGGAGAVWQPASLTNILDRAEVLPAHGHRRHFSRAALLAGLLVCPQPGCGRTMTPDVGRPAGRGYYCAQGKKLGSAVHGRWWAAESAVLPWIKTEVARLRTPDAAETAEADEQTRLQLAAKQTRVIDLYADGLIGKADRDRRLAAIAEQVAKLDARQEVVAIPAVDWDWPVEALNPVLHALFFPVRLRRRGPPQITWRVPEWRI